MKTTNYLAPSLIALAALSSSLQAQLLITEINSNGTGGDFWELTNVGTSSVDISGYKWNDNQRSFTGTTVVTIPANTLINAGESIVFNEVGSASVFRAAWGLSATVKVIPGGPGLAMNDAITLYNAAGTELLYLTYAANGFTRTGGTASAGGHAGVSAGGAATVSMVWDQASTSSPRYSAASVGNLGSFVNPTSAVTIGSPGFSGFAVPPPSVTLSVSATPTTFAENAANPASIGTVSRAVATAAPLVVNLASSDVSEANFPTQVTILANETSANFDITAVNDSFPDGTQTATITASAADSTTALAALTVTDDGDVVTSNLMLTEILSNQSSPNTAGAVGDYWELTNFGTSAVDLSGYSWHDSGLSSSAAAGYALPSGSSIAAGESVIFTVVSPSIFRTWWGLAPSVQIFQTIGAPGLGSGDGVSFFDNTGNQMFFFSYAANGFTRADGNPSTTAHAGPSAGGAADTVALIWEPTTPTTVTTGTAGPQVPRYTFATGTNFGSSVAATSLDIGSPGRTVGPPSVSIANASAAEGNSGTSTLALAVTRTDVSTAFSVDYAVTGGTADGTDYTLASGTLNFTAAGVASLPINITVNGDNDTEPNETVIVTLSNIVNTAGSTIIGTATGTATILTDDAILPLITTQPDSTTLTTGKATTLVVAASGSPAPTIQWYQGNSGDVSNPVSGATSAVFLTPELSANASYWARATSGASTVDSATATVTIVAGVTGVDLATYVRVGRHNLPHPSRDPAPAGNLLAEEASGVAYNWDTDTLFVIGDGGQSITQVTKTGVLVNSMTLPLGGSPQGTEFYDPEGITYIGNGQFVFTEERDRQAVKFTYAPGTTLTRAATQTMKLGTTIGNIGLEGLSYDPQTSGFIFVKESGPIGIFQTTIDFTALTASNGSPTTINSTDLFTPTLASTLDMSDVYAFSNIPSMIGQPQSGNLLVISQESARIVNIDRAGSVASSLTLVSDPGNISIQAQTHEGVVMDPTGRMYVVSEAGGGTDATPQVWVFGTTNATNQPPTAVVLSNTATSIPDNTNTASAIKVADIAVTDDGLGTNTLSVTGTDASFFEITGNALFLKAGTVLSFPTKPGYSITVRVDDTNVGSTPDATVNYTLAITAAPTGVATLIISEVAPWSSGNSSLGSDWFEVTNIGTSTADINGWKVDDSSNAFANSVALNGITSIAPGESVIFIESATPKSTEFINIWFGGIAPAGLQVGTYAGSGIGLSTGGDALNLFDSAGTVRANVVFGSNAPTPPGPYRSFDNAIGLNNTTITTPSSTGVNGAFSVTDTVVVNPATIGTLIGSPGVIAGAMPIISIVATDATASENGANSGTFRVSRTGSLIGPLTANFNVASGAGQAIAADFTPSIGTSVVIPSSMAFADITITPVVDSLGEGDETVTLTLFDTGSYDVGSPATATVTIGDNRFGTWLFANGYTSTGLGADSDGDGIKDGMEFFFNANPNNGAGSGNFPQLFPNAGALELDFARLTDSTGVTGALQVSSDLTTWSAAILGLDYTVASSVPTGDETAVTYALPGTGPSAAGVSPQYLTPNTSDPIGASLGGVRVVNEGLVGVGRISGENLDQFGETQGAASGLFISGWAWNGSQFSGKFNVLPDRGFNAGTIFSNYAARLHEVNFTFVPYYGMTAVAQGQIVPTYANSTKFTYLDGMTPKFTTGLNPTGTSTLLGQTVGTVTAANGPGGAQESLLSFDAEAVHLFADGSGFVSDEYGTYIARFNAAKQITGITQLPTAARPHNATKGLDFTSTTPPAQVSGRRVNQGLEGMSVTPDGTLLFAVMQSALVQDSSSNASTRNNTRLFVYNVAGANRETPVLIGEYVVKLPQIDLNGNNSALDGTAAQSEIVAIGTSSFLMLPRDGNGMGRGTTDPIVFKSVQLVDFASATNILGTYDAQTAQVSPAGVLIPGVKAAAAAEIINMLEPTDLAKFGLNASTNPSSSNTLNEKMEGMALVPDLSTPQANDFFLFLANDNDFQSSEVKMINAAGNLINYGNGRLSKDVNNDFITNDAMFYAYRITIDASGKKFFRMGVTGNN